MGVVCVSFWTVYVGLFIWRDKRGRIFPNFFFFTFFKINLSGLAKKVMGLLDAFSTTLYLDTAFSLVKGYLRKF